MGYVVGNFPEEKQVLATSTAGASNIEEGLCALLAIPAFKRLGPDGAVQESAVEWPSAIPKADAAAAAASNNDSDDQRSPFSSRGSSASGRRRGPGGSGSTPVSAVTPFTEDESADGRPRRVFSSGHGEEKRAERREEEESSPRPGVAKEPALVAKTVPVHQRLDQPAVKATPTSKERLLQDTRQALLASTTARNAPATTVTPDARSLSPKRWLVATSPTSKAAAAFASVGTVAVARLAKASSAVNLRSSSLLASTGGFRRDSSGKGSSANLNRGSPPAYASVSKGLFHSVATVATSSSVFGSASGGRGELPAWPCVGGKVVTREQAAALMSVPGAHDDDSASTLDLRSPETVKAVMVHQQVTLMSQQRQQQQHFLDGRGQAGVGAGAVLVVAKEKGQGAVSVRNTPAQQEGEFPERPRQGGQLPLKQIQQQNQNQNHHHQQQQARHQQQKLPILPEHSSPLLREWDVPPVLVDSLEAKGISAPTGLQAAVWAAGRGVDRTDLLVHVSFFFLFIC